MPTEQPIGDPILLRPHEAAQKLAISERKLWSLTRNDEIRAIRIGRSVRYDVRDLRAWIEYKKEHPSTDRTVTRPERQPGKTSSDELPNH